MAFDRDYYVQLIRHWMAALDDSWDEGLGYYRIPQSTRSNGMLIPPMLVLAAEGEAWCKERILRMAARMVQSPPYDERYRYFNWNMNQTGGEIHQAGCMTQIGLSFVLRFADMLGLPDDLGKDIRRKIHDSLQRVAEFGLYAKDSPFEVSVDEDGTPVNIGEERAEKVAKGLPENFGRLRQIGPNNQAGWEMRASAYAWKATGDECFLDFMDLSWRKVLQDEGSHLPHPSCFAEDWSFIYTVKHPLWNYPQSIYDFKMYWQYADCLRLLRQAGRSKPHLERFMKHWGDAVFTRSFLSDGATNMVFNTYGWERSVIGCTYSHVLGMPPIISVADFTPYDAGALKAIFERGVTRLQRWDFRMPFPPDLGIVGWSNSREEVPYELGLFLLDNPEALDVNPVPTDACLSSLAWKEGNFVIQTPVYHATVVGSSPGYNGMHGIPTSGGEFVVRVPDGDYLFPLSDNGRTSFGAVVEGEAIDSSGVTKQNAGDRGLKMAVHLPGGKTATHGSPFGPALYDARTEGITLETEFGDDRVRLRRELAFQRDHIAVRDRLIALREVTVQRAFSRIPLITVNPRGELPEITGEADGRPVAIGPPYYMGYGDADYLHHDQDFIRSLRSLELLRVVYPHYGFEVSRQRDLDMLLEITPWEWQETRRMRISGKNLDCVWIFEPTLMRRGESRGFCYELRPFSDGYML